MRNEGYSRPNQFISLPKIAKNKEYGIRVGPGIIDALFVNKYAVVVVAHSRWPYSEVGLEAMRPSNCLLGMAGCGGALTLYASRRIRNTLFP